MSRISLDPYFPDDPCFVCGETAKKGGVWRGHTTVVLCANCAWAHPQPLAALLADAIADLGGGHVDIPLEKFEREYWRALALALLWERRKKELMPA
jgi:hypothetical protein